MSEMNTSDPQGLLQELKRRKDALDSLAGFREFMHPSGHVDFQFPHAEHHEIMAAAFERVMRGETLRLMLMLPFASAKSTLLIQFALWWLARNPYHHILRVSATQSLSERFARRCRAAIQEKEFNMLSGTTLSSDVQSVANFATTAGGGITSAGVGTSIIGLRSNLNLLDDPVASWEQAHSESQRQAQIDWYFSEMRSRLVPGAPEIIVSTRWHHDDLMGHILRSEEADTWTILRIPMECDDPATDPLGRAFGERMWPEWYTEQMVMEAKRDPERWSGSFQQTPLRTEGDFLNPDDFEIIEEAPENMGRYGALDLAMTEKQSADATVIGCAGMDADGNLIILDMQWDRCSPEKTLENLIQAHEKWKFSECLVEDSPAEKVFRDLAHKYFRMNGKIIPLMKMPTRGRDKMQRAQSFRGLAKMGTVKLLRGPWNADFIRECTEFPYGKHDDAVDVAALFGQRAAKMSTHTSVKPMKRPMRFATQLGEDGRAYTTQTLDELWEENDDVSWREKLVRI
ncbi:phage terminase large subunit [Pseudohalioglobus lutimaris]|uniref:Terminase large subunit gp17-like C-terminal domain-containing protein n=1 Tax=Pseudohalioglobus lutimaris TaxID=1737061 RepID=A0A2N5X4P6_9GAMM|nr:phage terminase large subunit [Pseudohalioglobus lutimaris]PLW69450.1 hypothetical protein C0039_07950 [Pseudohalioglobus lutimaris]